MASIVQQACEHRCNSRFDDSRKLLEPFVTGVKQGYPGNIYYDCLVEYALAIRGFGESKDSLLKANEYLIQAINEFPAGLSARLHLGTNLRFLNCFPSSVRVLQESVNLIGESPFLCYELAESYFFCGKYQQARELIEAAIKLEPHTHFYLLALDIAKKCDDVEKYGQYLDEWLKNDPANEIEVEAFLNGSWQNSNSTVSTDFCYENGNKLIKRINLLIRREIFEFNHFRRRSYCISNCPKIFVSIEEVYELIFKSIQNNEPLSVIRAGDGEGLFYEWCSSYLSGSKEDFDLHASLCGQGIWRVWFGLDIHTENIGDLKRLYSDLQRSFENASVLGVQSRLQDHRVSYLSHHGCKGANNLLEMATNNFSGKLYDGGGLHEDLFKETDFYKRIFSSGRRISLITCHKNLKEILQAQGVQIIQNFIIPTMVPTLGSLHPKSGASSHFREDYQRILSEISADHDIFLVAAGVLGKVYCEKIREMGGRALDIGAMADAFVGLNTRPSIWSMWEKKRLW